MMKRLINFSGPGACTRSRAQRPRCTDAHHRQASKRTRVHVFVPSRASTRERASNPRLYLAPRRSAETRAVSQRSSSASYHALLFPSSFSRPAVAVYLSSGDTAAVNRREQNGLSFRFTRWLDAERKASRRHARKRPDEVTKHGGSIRVCAFTLVWSISLVASPRLLSSREVEVRWSIAE